MKDLLVKINFKKILQYALYMLIVLVFQNMVLTQFRIGGVCCLFVPAVAAAVGMFEEPVFATIFALILGIFQDYAFIENSIFFTLMFPFISFISGFISRFFINKRFFAFMFIAAFAIALTTFAQMLQTITRDSWSIRMIYTSLLQIIISLFPSALVYFGPSKWIKS